MINESNPSSVAYRGLFKRWFWFPSLVLLLAASSLAIRFTLLDYAKPGHNVNFHRFIRNQGLFSTPLLQ